MDGDIRLYLNHGPLVDGWDFEVNDYTPQPQIFAPVVV